MAHEEVLSELLTDVESMKTQRDEPAAARQIGTITLLQPAPPAAAPAATETPPPNRRAELAAKRDNFLAELDELLG